jgi:hypothetical protein
MTWWDWLLLGISGLGNIICVPYVYQDLATIWRLSAITDPVREGRPVPPSVLPTRQPRP